MGVRIHPWRRGGTLHSSSRQALSMAIRQANLATEWPPTRTEPERNLWASVLRVAVWDADGKGGKGYRDNAVEYLTRESGNLKLVCEFAGFPLDTALKAFRKRYAKISD